MCIQGATNPHQQLFTGVSVTVHENYPGGATWDIAVIRLRKPLVYNDYVQPICIPSTAAAGGTKCVATGWGATKGTLNGIFSVHYKFTIFHIHQRSKIT